MCAVINQWIYGFNFLLLPTPFLSEDTNLKLRCVSPGSKIPFCFFSLAGSCVELKLQENLVKDG